MTILPFKAGSQDIDGSFGQRFATELYYRLRNDFGTLFMEVRRRDTPLGRDDELVVSGTITKLVFGGEAVGQVSMGGVFARGSVFAAEVSFSSGRATAPFFVGSVNESRDVGPERGIERKQQEAAASVANTIARGKGWRP